MGSRLALSPGSQFRVGRLTQDRLQGRWYHLMAGLEQWPVDGPIGPVIENSQYQRHRKPSEFFLEVEIFSSRSRVTNLHQIGKTAGRRGDKTDIL